MKVICGQAPAIPWWRLQSMSDADIAQHNRKYLMELEMGGCDENEHIKDTGPDSSSTLELRTAMNVDAWNAAIEAAADEAYKMVDKIGYDLYHAIKELKK